LSVVLLFTASDYLFGIFKLLFVQENKEKLEDNKEESRRRKKKNDRQYNDKMKRAKGQREA
jgi:hypothetical protein